MPSISPYDSNYFESSIDASDLQAVISLRNIKSLTLERISKLNALGIFTVSDLIRYKPIHDAKFLSALETGEIVHDYDYGHLADNTGKSLKELLGAECVELKSVSVDDNVILKTSLGINTISDLADYSAYSEALELIEKSNNVFSEVPSAPNELIPKLKGSVHSYARYVSYIRESTVKLPSSILAYDDYTKNVADGLLQELLIPIELKDNQSQVIPQLIKIHLGYIAEFKQKWTFVSTQLGEIVHSLALAPGESRNITIIDWKRSQITSKKEDTGVSEQLTNELVHRRALDEVTTATAREHVQGRTDVEGGTIGGSMAVAGGASGNAGAGGKGKTDALGVPADVTAAAGAATSTGAGMVISGGYAKGTVTSSNDGERTVTGNLSQDIMDTVSQKASNLRSLWSVVVAEDNQTENKQINTRNVTNYNHSHALTIQYYEVLHRYRAETTLSNVVPILYLPYHPLKFNIELIVKYWGILKSYLDSGNELVKKMEPVITYYNSGGAIYDTKKDLILKKIGVSVTISKEVAEIEKADLVNRIDGATIHNNPGRPWAEAPTINIPNVTNGNVRNINANAAPPHNYLPLEFNSESAIPAVPSPISFNKIIINSLDANNLDIYIKFTFDNKGEEIIRDINVTGIRTINGIAEYQLPIQYINLIDKKRPSDQMISEIVNHFNAHRYFFTRILLQSIEQEQLIDLIQGVLITANTEKIYLTDLIDFAPIGITDNTIIFKLKKFSTETKSTTENEKLVFDHFTLKDKNPLPQPDYVESIKKIVTYYSAIKDLPNSKDPTNAPVSDDIYLPTSGIFAEAILGRSNASEKIDITRFYNWQDSPIPHLAPEIAPVDPNADLNKGPLNTTSNIPGSVLNIINPPAVPDPTGLAASLQAVQNGNMFRDMSKSETLLGVLTNLSNFSTELAKQASTMAGDAQKSTLNAANDIAKSVLNALPKDTTTGTGKTTPGSNLGNGNNNGKGTPTVTSPVKPAVTATEKGAALNMIEQAKKEGAISKEDAEASKILTAGGTYVNRAEDDTTSNSVELLDSDEATNNSLNPIITAAGFHDIFHFNYTFANSILQNMDSTNTDFFIGVNPKRDSKVQLEKITSGIPFTEKEDGYPDKTFDPTTDVIKILPLMDHISTHAQLDKNNNIIFGSFLRPGHDKICIDINLKLYKGILSKFIPDTQIINMPATHDDPHPKLTVYPKASALLLVITILTYLKDLPIEFRKNLRIGLPFQDPFFPPSRRKLELLGKIPAVSLHLEIQNDEVKALIEELGTVVFPDNDDHMHIQV
ncbi:MAG: hypothetical protein ABI594_08870 [Ginsengibacter sp.]